MENKQINITPTVAAWADIVLKIWREKLVAQHIYNTGALYNSLKYELLLNAGNSPEKVEFTYNFYGFFVDTGTLNMEKREWYGKVFYAQVMRLKEILVERYGQNVAAVVTSHMQPGNFSATFQ